MSDTATEYTPVEYVCKGRRLDREEGTLSVILSRLDDTNETNLLYTIQPGKKGDGVRWLRAGRRYSIPTNGTTITASAAKYLGPFEDADLCQQWQIETQTAEAELELLKQHGRNDRQELLTALLPLRRLYSRTIGTGKRTALELSVLAVLRTAPRKGEE